MKARPGQKIKLTSIDELLGVNNEESALDLEIVKIRSFRNHPFKVLDDEKMQDLVDSIRANGILSPVLVRPIGNDIYEMVSGHRRMHAAELLGMETLPAIIREMTDDEAIVKMVDANIQREELLPSEKAFAYKMKLDAIRRQAGRPSKGNSAQIGRNLESADLVGEQVGESRMQVRRYIRLTEIQKWLFEYIKENGAVKLNQISLLRDQLQTGAITQARMIDLLNNSQPGKAPSSKLTFTEKKLREYFPESYSTKQMRDIIEDLLTDWKRSREEFMEEV